MLIGILSPVFYTGDNPGVSDRVYLITAINASKNIDSVKLELDVEISQPDEPSDKRTYKQIVARPEDADPEEDWTTYLPLPLVIEEWRNGTRITGHLKANNCRARASITAQIDQQD